MSANDKCPAHYTKSGEQHWDRMWRLHGRGYFVGCATGYTERYHKKNGLDDLKKAIHFLEKLCELEKAAADGTGPLGAEGTQPPVPLINTSQTDSLRPYDQPTAEGSKGRWLDMLTANHVAIRTPHENVHGYVVREGVLWCPHCGCPHDSFDPFKKGLTCAQCKKPLTTFEESVDRSDTEKEKPCDGEKDHESHHFEPLPDYEGAACHDCGAISGMPSAKLPCPKIRCSHCRDTGVVACEWHTGLTQCPACQAGYNS